MKRAAREDDQDYSDSSSSAPTAAKRSSRDDDSRKATQSSIRTIVGEGTAKARRSRRSEEEDVPLTFPQRLMEVLENEMLNNILSWLPHGRAFAIWDKRKFARDVMGKYFKQSKFTSFTRKLNRWGFERVARGPETGAYYHPLFQRNNLRLCLQMTCQGTKAHYQQKDTAHDQENEDVAKAVPSSDGIMDGAGGVNSTIQELANEAQIQVTEMASQRSFNINANDAQDSAAVGREVNLSQIGRLENVIEETLLKHHLANRAAADAAALGVSRQGLLDALVGGIHSSASNSSQCGPGQGNSLLQQFQLEEARRKLPSIQLGTLTSTEGPSLSTVGAGLVPGLGDLSGLAPSPSFGGSNTTNHLQLRQLDEIWRMLRQPLIPTAGSVESALLGTSSSLGATGAMGSSSNARGAPVLPGSSNSVLASQGTGGWNVSQLEEVRKGILLQQQIQLAQQSMLAASRPNTISSLSSGVGVQSTSTLLGSMLPSNASNDYLSMIMAQEAAQRQIRESFGTSQQHGLHHPENLNIQSQDQLNQQVLQLLQQASTRQMIGRNQRHSSAEQDDKRNK